MDFLCFDFSTKELEHLMNKGSEKKDRTCFEFITDLVENIISYIFKIGVLLAIILVNLMIIERLSLTEKAQYIEDNVFGDN